MTVRHIVFALLLSLAISTAVTAQGTRLLRHPTVSRDLVAFEYAGDLWAVPRSGGQARRHGVPTFGITDTDKTPIARFCDRYIAASVARASFLDSYVASVAAINAILVACAHSQPKRSLEVLAQSDKEDRSGARWYRGIEDSDQKSAKVE